MKLCIPIKEKNGLESRVYSHFGSASAFLLYDSKTDEHEILDNSNQHHAHGGCQPLESINDKNVDAVLVGGIGAGAISKLNARNIKVYQAVNDTVQINVDMFKKSQLPELTAEDACRHHNHGGGGS